MKADKSNGLNRDGMLSWRDVYRAEKEHRLTKREVEKLAIAVAPKPPTPITLRDAADKFGVSLIRLRAWVKRGHLDIVGRQKAPVTGGLILVDENQVAEIVASPPKVGRPSSNSFH